MLWECHVFLVTSLPEAVNYVLLKYSPYISGKQPSEMFYKKRCSWNFAKFTGKHLCQILFFNKVAGLRPKPVTSLTKRLWHGCFPIDFAKFLRTPVFKEHLRWLLLNEVSPLKMKVRHCNHNPFMSKLLRKAIMERSDWK